MSFVQMNYLINCEKNDHRSQRNWSLNLNITEDRGEGGENSRKILADILSTVKLALKITSIYMENLSIEHLDWVAFICRFDCIMVKMLSDNKCILFMICHYQ